MATGRFFPASGIDLGTATSYATFLQNSLPRPGMLGQIFEDSGNVYKLVALKNVTGVATVAGDICYYIDTTYQNVSTKASETVAVANGVAGGTLGTITSAQSNAAVFNYIFIQIGGLQASVATSSAGTVAGDQLQGDGATDKQMVRVAAGSSPTNVVFAIAMGAAAGGTNRASVRWLVGQLIC